MEASLSDAEAAVRVRQGDKSAYGALVRNHQESAFRTAFLILRDAAAAEDVSQEAFVRAYRSFDRFRETEPFRPWLLRIVTNLALNSNAAKPASAVSSTAFCAYNLRRKISAPTPDSMPP